MNHKQSPIEQAYLEGYADSHNPTGYWDRSDAKEINTSHVTISRDDLQCAVEALASTVAEYDRLCAGFPKGLAVYDEDRAALERLRAILSLNEVHAER